MLTKNDRAANDSIEFISITKLFYNNKNVTSC